MRKLFDSSSQDVADIVSVKIVAIAKNEAAYLAEWIYHHLYFGFEKLEIHINRSTDNSFEYATAFDDDDRVEIVDANEFFDKCNGNPQVEVYKKALNEAKNERYSHILFIDIDEFWTPVDLTTSINAFVSQSENFDVLCFEWANKIEATDPFVQTVESPLELSKGRHVKSLISANVLPKKLTAHSVNNPSLLYRLADGDIFDGRKDNFALVAPSVMKEPVKPAFIIHRMFRSQLEYVALLGRGRPNSRHKAEGTTSLKSNRNGYGIATNRVNVTFDAASLDAYKVYMSENLTKEPIVSIVETGRIHVKQSFNNVLQIIENAPASEAELISKVLTRVTLPEVIDAHNVFKSKNFNADA